jgi:hypothetical protein
MDQTTSHRPIPELGFTRSFIAHLQNSKEQLSRYVDKQKAQAVAMQASLDKLQSNQQEIVNEMMERLKKIQLQRGIVSNKHTPDCTTDIVVNNSNSNTAAHMKDKKEQMEQDLAQALASFTQSQAHLEGTFSFYLYTIPYAASTNPMNIRILVKMFFKEFSQRKLVLERGKAEQVKKMRHRALEAEKTTVNNSTCTILKYRMLGLDFVKGEAGPTSLRCNFTLIDPADPSRIFSFGLNLSPEEEEYQVGECVPPLPSHVILRLVEELNASSNQVDALPVFIRGIRQAFKQYAL